MNLQNKVVVIVGGSQGIGKELALQLIKEGSSVTIVSKNRERLETTARTLGVSSITADVQQEEDLIRIGRHVHEKDRRIDLWINCAGVFKVFPKDKLIDMKRAHEMFDINFFGVVFGSRTALSYMKEQGGIILNILSSAALDATRAKNAKLYAASKWAVRGYVEALRGENRDSRVSILSVYPGGTKTHLHDESLPEDFPNFMEPEYVVTKIIANLKKDEPDPDLIIKRPMAT